MSQTTPTDFRDNVAKGLGRAHCVLEDGCSPEQADVVVTACLEDLSYDAQSEGSRAGYLMDLVRLAGAEGQLAKELEDILSGDPDHHAIDQRFELAAMLAKENRPAVREAMYLGQERLIDRWLAERPVVMTPYEPALQITSVDGIEGAIFAFGQLGRIASKLPDTFQGDSYLLDEARALIGPEMDLQLSEARATKPLLDAYLRSVETERTRGNRSGPPANAWLKSPWAEAQQFIGEAMRRTKWSGYFTWQWGAKASDDQLRLAAQALVGLPREGEKLLCAYVSIFARRPYPLDPATLIALVDDPRENVAWFAINALCQLQHPDVRTVALRMADQRPVRQRSLDLLAGNWQPGDEAIAEALLRSEQHRDAIHKLGMGLRAVIERHCSAELVPVLLLGYEKTPCSACRSQFVEALLRLEALTRQLREECRWDASEATRRLVLSPSPTD